MNEITITLSAEEAQFIGAQLAAKYQEERVQYLKLVSKKYEGFAEVSKQNLDALAKIIVELGYWTKNPAA